MTTTTPPSETVAIPAPAGLARIGAPVAGVVSAGAAVAFGEIVSDHNEGIPSLVIAAGEWFIDIVPGSVAEQGIEWFGTNDKLALVIGTLVILAAAAAWVGRAAWRNRLIGDLAYAAFGLFGAWLAAREPLSDSAPSFVVGLLAAVVGAVVLRFLLRRLDVAVTAEADSLAAAPESPTDPTADRRAFFTYAGGVALTAAGAVGISRSLRGQSAAQRARDELVAATPEAASNPSELLDGVETFDEVEGITSYITPSTGSEFYRIDTALTVPQVDPAGWKLSITGMVDDPYEIAYDELLAMEQNDEAVTLSCVSNEVGGGLVGTAVWTGVPLSEILDRASVQDGAEQVMGRSVDNFTAGFPTDVVYDGRSALLVTRMNGEPLPIRHGFPARLVVAGLYGYVSAVKWLDEIKLTTFDELGYWMPRGWSQFGPMKIQSRIDVPRHRDEVAAGRHAIAGVAWAPVDGVAQVQLAIGNDEISDDWVDAKLAEAVSDETWVQWLYEWDAEPGEYIVRVRAINKNGTEQPVGPAPVAPNGAEGYHTIGITVT